MSIEGSPLAGSFAPSGGNSHKNMNVVPQDDRMDQIMKIDAQALLKTIRDLEQRLTEHQRPDSMPPWALALETRMEQLEKLRSSAPEAESKEDNLAPKPLATEAVNLSTLTMEERIIAKIRNEFETKIGNSQLHFEGIISSYSLEMERIHKLLMIRPTTSELQHVVLNVQQQEARTQQHLQEMQNFLMASVRDRISEEMVGCLLELRNARAAGEESARLIAKQVADFTAQMGELREGAQNSIVALQEAQAEAKLLIEAQKGDIEQSRRQLKDEIYKINSIAMGLKNDVKATGDALVEHSARTEDSIAKLDDRLKAENKRLEKEIVDLTARLAAAEHAQSEAEATLAQVKFNFEREMDELREWRGGQDRKFQDADKRQTTSEKQIMDLITQAQAFDTQITKNAEHSDKLAADVEALTTLCQQTLAADIKSNTLKISLLQEQVNIAIPKTLMEHAKRMNDLLEDLRCTSESIEILKGRHDAEDELIASLLPLKDKVAFLSDAKTAHDQELENLKEGITACMDANSEFARRMEEFEESMESFDESINSRMNRIRDTLLDTLLEKQGQHSATIRNTRENMEVMSMAAGEAGLSIAGNAASDAKGKGSGGALGPRMTVVHREGDTGGGPALQGPASANLGQLKRLQSFRRPTIQGAIVQGNNIPPAGGSPGGSGVPPASSTTSSQGSMQPPAPQQSPGGGGSGGAPMLTPGAPPAGAMLRRGGSIRMQHQTQNILAQHRKVMGMATHAEGAAEASGFVPSGHAPGGGQTPTGHAPAHPAHPPMQSQASASAMTGESAPTAVTTARSSMVTARSQPGAVHIPQPQPVDGASVSPEAPGHATGAAVAAGDQPEGDHPPIELSPTAAKQSVSGADFATFPAHDDVAEGGGSHTEVDGFHDDAAHYAHQPAAYQQPFQPQQSYGQAPYSAPGGLEGGFAMPSVVSVASRPDALSGEYQHMLHAPAPLDEANMEQEAQFLADLCLNFEDISLKRKKVSSLPLAFCQSIAQIARGMAELIAEQADFEMVEQAIAAVNGPLVVQDVTYDDAFVVNTRQKKQDEYIDLVLRFVNSQVSNGGVLRSDARQLFIALVRKALDMFMSKHNQVLVAGNSRLGRTKIPTCIACDRPLVEKTRLDRAVASPPGTRGLLEQSAATLRSGWSAPGGSQFMSDDDPASNDFVQRAYPAVHLENSFASGSQHVPAKGILGRGLLTASVDSQRPKTMSGGSRSSLSGHGNNAKALRSATLRPNSSAMM